MRRQELPDLTPRVGPVSDELRHEYGALEIWHLTVTVSRDAAAWGRERLLRLSDGYRPGEVLRARGRLRTHQADRGFARQVGLDPDDAGFRADIAARDAALAGRLVPTGAVSDALLAVAVTSGVSVVALDARTVCGAPGLRLAVQGERLGRGRRAEWAEPGTIVVADDRSPLAPLFADPPRAHDGRRARTVVLFAVDVPDGPPWEVSEAVWTASRYLSGT